MKFFCVSLLVFAGSALAPLVEQCPGPGPCPVPTPKPPPAPVDPVPPPKAGSWINGISQGGLTITCDLPNDQQMRNVGSKLDGSGMCVFSAIEMAARYQHLEAMRGWRDWCAANYRGGGYPQKVDQLLAAWFKTKGISPIPYLQYEGNDPDQLMQTIDKTSRMGCITYGYSPRYGKTISHMVNCILYRGNYATVLDNNFVGDNQYEWMGRPELVRRMQLGQGSCWVFVWLPPGSPPPPKGKVK